MALVSYIDKESGSSDSMSNPIIIYDDAQGFVSAEAAVAKAQLDAPEAFFGNAQDAVPDITRIAPYAVEVRINYRARQLRNLRKPLPGATNSCRYYSPPIYTQSKLLYCYLSPATVFNAAGEDVSATYPEFQYSIDLPSGQQFLVQTPGHTFEPATVSDGYHIYLENVSVTRTYLRTIRDMVKRGVFNNADFLNDEAGTIQIVSFSAQQRTDNDWDLDFGFAHVPKQTNLIITADITLPVVYGYQYWYERFKLLPIEQGGNVVQVIQGTEFVVLGDVWPLDDFSKLNVFDPENL